MSRQPNGGFIGKENITDNTNASGVYTLSDVTQKVADNEFPTARYTPSRSLRFSAARSTYLSRTPAAGNRKTWTWSGWVKYSANDNGVFNAPLFWVPEPSTGIMFEQSPNTPHRIYVYNTGELINTTQFFRDASSWYHIVAVIDNTQATAADRTKLYINGVQVTAFAAAAYPALNADGGVNAAVEHNIGRQVGLSRYFDGYMAEVNFVDGQALDPAYFGEYEARTGEWKAKRYAGTYGTNGFYLSFANNSSTSALGLDDATGVAGSGAGSNDWTANNFSLAAGADYDSMVDVPGVGSAVITDTGGVVRGNYCTFNPNIGATSSGGHLITYSYGNLSTTSNASPGSAPRMNSFGTMPIPSSGKWYWESTNMSNASSGISKGVLYTATSGSGVDSVVAFFTSDGTAVIGNGASGTLTGTGSSLTTSDVLGTAYDADNNIVYWYKNGVLQQTMSGITSTNTSAPWVATRSASTSGSSISAIFNFGQQPFAYTAPSGFKSLCTTNLPEPVIKRPIDHFDVKLWTGNGAGLTIGNTARERDNYEISRSLRFNSLDSAYLNRTPSVESNRKTWTWSAWVKLSAAFSTARRLFSARVALTGDQTFIQAASDNTILIGGNSGAYELRTTATFVNSSSWYHIVLAFDTTQAVAANRIKLYVNGLQVTQLQTATYPSQNLDTFVNTTIPHSLGAETGTPSEFLDGYLTEINFIDGQALDPEAFGVFDVDGSWQAKQYAGTYGTNGFYLDFSDNSATTATTLGKDRAGANNWTPNNFSVTAGIDNDSVVDVPTDFGGDAVDSGGEVRGNYATLGSSKHPDTVLSNGNLAASGNVIFGHVQSTVFANNGKWYFEAQLITQQGDTALGLGNINSSPTSTFTGETVNSVGYLADGRFFFNSNVLATYSSYTTTDIVSCAFDTATGKIWIAKNNIWQNSGNPEAGTGQVHTVSWTEFGALARTVGIGVINFNFGQRAFAYDPPTGFKSLNTKNLNEQSPFVSGPDLVWTKSRSFENNHHIFDSVRGPTLSLKSSSMAPEDVRSTTLQSFNSNGFSLGSSADVNGAGNTYVAWCWNAGSRTVGNQDGTITSTIRANPENGLSIISYTGNGVAGATVGHGLGVEPSLVIIKSRAGAGDRSWPVFTDLTTQASGSIFTFSTFNIGSKTGGVLALNLTSGVGAYGQDGQTNLNGAAYIAYCWAEVEGYSKFGTYTGNNNTDGPFVYTGFRPAWIIIRSTTGARDWLLWDTARGTANGLMDGALQPNTAGTAYTGSVYEALDLVSNGFKLRTNGTPNMNTTETYFYMAFAEQPFKYALAR